MDEELARTEKDSKNDGSFMFAISLIVASLTVAYKTYVYFFNNLVTRLAYPIILISFFIIVIIFTSMSLFILMKAISLEVKNPTVKKNLETCAASCYLTGFLGGTIYLISLLFSCALKVVFDFVCSLLNIPNISFKFLFFYYIIDFMAVLIFFQILLKSSNRVKELLDAVFKEVKGVHCVIVVLGLALIFFVPLFYMPNNYVTIEADDIYSKQSEQIPIDITVTGRQYDYITINLSKADIKGNLKLIDSINMKINSDPNKVISSEYLIGNNFEFGKYRFYINNTNLSEGYYVLSVTTKNEFFKIISMETKTKSFCFVSTKN